ncbi:MAG: N-formylglutamate amidohydrolase [Pseudomonadota bacterium]
MTSAFLISLPHCSSKIPDELFDKFALNKDEILESEDFGTKEIFNDLSIPAIQAQFSRLVVDLNRNPENIDIKGVVAKTDYSGLEIFKSGQYPDLVTIDQLIDTYYRPYHDDLEKAFARPEIKFLFDCHSLNGIGPKDAPDAGFPRKDIILSNNGDTKGNFDPVLGPVSCPKDKILLIKSICESFGFSVSINYPYKGGFITVSYGRKYPDKNVLQIELNQDLFMNPDGKTIDHLKIKKIRNKFIGIFKEFSDCFL